MNVWKKASAAACLIAALALAPAAADARHRDPERNSPESVRALHDYARCVARDHWARPRLRTILAMDYRADAARDALRNFVMGQNHCVAPRHALSAGNLLFAGALAEELLPRDHDLAGLVAWDPARPPIEARDEREVMSLCAVRAAPADVAALLATPPASPEEAAALRAISPLLGRCLRAGAQTRVNGLEVRALLALAAWRLGDQDADHAAGPEHAPQR
jgi:hypothetical protein